MSSVPPAAARRTLTLALIGNPNTGKSTLFNALAGMHARVGNFPGVTVEKKTARIQAEGHDLLLVDLPGTYSVSPRSADEMVTVDLLLGRQADVPAPDVVVCVLDAANLSRNLYLVSQLRDMGLPLVLVLNMWDVAERRGIQIDREALARRLGVPVVCTEAHRRRGLDNLKETIVGTADREPPPPKKLFPEPFYRECELLTSRLRDDGAEVPAAYLVERLLLDHGGYVEAGFLRRDDGKLQEDLREARSRLAAEGCTLPAVEARVRYRWIADILQDIVHIPTERPVTLSDRLDRLLTHRFWGLAIFAALMFVVFQSIYRWAGPLMDIIETAQGMAGDWIAGSISPGPFRSLLVDAVVAGIGSVLVFLPQIAFLFFFIAILEDCGYMARAAFLMDKLMSKVGLSGKSFVPLMSSFACAIPGVMATRVIENRRDRMVTILVAPLMSCSARLPVYLLLIGAFVPATAYLGGWISLQGLVLFAMSSLGAVVAIPTAWILKKTMFRGETPPFVMELPSYKWPSPAIVLHRVWDRSAAFVRRAGTLIFATTVLVWAAGYFPADHTRVHQLRAELESRESDSENPPEGPAAEELLQQIQAEEGRLIAQSFLGRAGQAIEPVVRPLGWDWRIGVGALASFPAREVIIATLGTIYSLGGDVDEEDEGLLGAIRSARWPDGQPVFNLPVALSVMVFFALCAQCGATLMVIRRETNSWRWPLVTFTYMTVLAYVGALATYQIGMRLLGG